MQSDSKSSSSYNYNPGYVEETNQEENNRPSVSPEVLEEQKANEFVTMLAELLCSQKQLIKRLENANNQAQKKEITAQIDELKNEINILENKIQSTFPTGDYFSEINTQAQQLANNC